MRVEPSLRQAVVLVLADDVVHDVSKQPSHHEDLHVVALPAVLQVGWDLGDSGTKQKTCLYFVVIMQIKKPASVFSEQ